MVALATVLILLSPIFFQGNSYRAGEGIKKPTKLLWEVNYA